MQVFFCHFIMELFVYGTGVYVLIAEQLVVADLKHVGKIYKLDVGHKAFPGFDALDGVFVHVHAVELKPGGKTVLRQM